MEAFGSDEEKHAYLSTLKSGMLDTLSYTLPRPSSQSYKTPVQPDHSASIQWEDSLEASSHITRSRPHVALPPVSSRSKLRDYCEQRKRLGGVSNQASHPQQEELDAFTELTNPDPDVCTG